MRRTVREVSVAMVSQFWWRVDAASRKLVLPLRCSLCLRQMPHPLSNLSESQTQALTHLNCLQQSYQRAWCLSFSSLS
ncbi:hypothetical protein P280DRAFT_472033 [Massarina eburnea CBS 473.64]|uniref:Uncharacterized protein n=1 Tax=Massarina eburnea CBS 473.64 TaxID=1395130 RepID=A0A6A6RV63_9PLEO|nr:hypothetical protein P280DRAFT_472033 [Massarina eburnea CBS 473.64]